MTKEGSTDDSGTSTKRPAAGGGGVGPSRESASEEATPRGWDGGPTADPGRVARRRRERGHRRVGALGSLYLLALIAVAALSTGFYINAVPSGPRATRLAPPVQVELGTPVPGFVPCGNGTTLYAETIAWNGSTENLSTAQIYVKLVELVDGDFIGTQDPPATVTASNACTGNPPSGPFAWYLVVQAPRGGSFLAVYSYVLGWTGVGGAPQPTPFVPGTTLTLMSVRSFAHNGYGFAVEGSALGPAVHGEVAL